MMIEEFGQYVASLGYRRILTQKENICIFCRQEKEQGYAVLWVEVPEGSEWTPQQQADLKAAAAQLLMTKGLLQVSFLTLLVTADWEIARNLTQSDDHCWIIDPYRRELVLYENQYGDMDGLRAAVEGFLSKQKGRGCFGKRTVPWVSVGLVCLNVILFLVCTFTGNLLYNKGAFSLENILRNGEWYRVVTALFLHVDLEHLFSNMLLLYFTGELTERYLGHRRFGCLYLAAGIGGNLLSMVYEWFTGFYSSVGASGAVFGIVGMLLALVLQYHGRLEQITLKRLVLMIVLSVYNGAANTEVNNIAHVGGLLTGFLLTLLTEGLLKGKERAVQKK